MKNIILSLFKHQIEFLTDYTFPWILRSVYTFLALELIVVVLIVFFGIILEILGVDVMWTEMCINYTVEGLFLKVKVWRWHLVLLSLCGMFNIKTEL